MGREGARCVRPFGLLLEQPAAAARSCHAPAALPTVHPLPPALRQALPRPFKKLRELDMEAVAAELAADLQ